MENASKALLIAGSILIAILLIAAGVSVYNSTQGTTDAVGSTMDVTTVTMFNNKFNPYIGTGKSKNEVIALLNVILANNSSNTRKVGIELANCNCSISDSVKTELASMQAAIEAISDLSNDSRFMVKVSIGWRDEIRDFASGYDSNGFINEIYIKKIS